MSGKNLPHSNQDAPVSHRDFTGAAVPGLELGPLFSLLGDDPVRDLPDRAGVELVKAKRDKGSRVYRAFLDLGRGSEELFIKTFDTRETFGIMAQRMFSKQGLRRPVHYPEKMIKMLFEPSLARRSWQAAAACASARVPVATHLAFLSRRQGVFREDVLVTRGVNPRSAPEARQFFDYYFQHKPRGDRSMEKGRLIDELGALLARVVESRIMFPDFKLHNLVLDEDPERGPCFVVIDLSEAVLDRPDFPELVFLERFFQSLPTDPIFSFDDRARLVQSYLQARNDPRSWREVCEGIRQRAEARGRDQA